MNKAGAFRVPDREPGRLHLYRVAGEPGSRSGITLAGEPYDEFEVDLFSDEDEVYVCDLCKRKTDTGWLHAGDRVACRKCTVARPGPYEPCVLFHKFSRRCWSDELADDRPGRAWTDQWEKATVYPDLKTAEAAKETFLGPVRRAIEVVPLDRFDEVLARYKENL